MHFDTIQCCMQRWQLHQLTLICMHCLQRCFKTTFISERINRTSTKNQHKIYKQSIVPLHWMTSLFGLVFRWVFSLSPKTNLNPEFWSQSEVRISSAKTGAEIATEYTRVVDFRLTRNIFTLYLLFCSSLSIALKRVLHKKWRNRSKES